jgi:uncharacterized protein
MGDMASLVRMNDKSPVIRLMISLFITVAAGTIFFMILIYCGSLIFGTTVSKMISVPLPGTIEDKIWITRYIQVSQQIGLFLIPALLLASILRKDGESFLSMDHTPAFFSTVLIIILIIIIIPVISWTGVVNSEMKLPGWLSGVEKMVMEKEERASDILGLLMRSESIGGMGLNLLILAVIPSFAEELLFRGIFQQLLIRVFRSGHGGVWITAVLFSAVHFQFYGFLPRMILGLVFGYLFLWTSSLWSAIIPHFLNNAIPVVITFISEHKELADRMKDETRIFPFIPVVLSALILYYIWYFNRNKTDRPDPI